MSWLKELFGKQDVQEAVEKPVELDLGPVLQAVEKLGSREVRVVAKERPPEAPSDQLLFWVELFSLSSGLKVKGSSDFDSAIKKIQELAKSKVSELGKDL